MLGSMCASRVAGQGIWPPGPEAVRREQRPWDCQTGKPGRVARGQLPFARWHL